MKGNSCLNSLCVIVMALVIIKVIRNRWLYFVFYRDHLSLALQSFHFELGRTDVYDDREAGMNYTVGNFAVDRSASLTLWLAIILGHL